MNGYIDRRVNEMIGIKIYPCEQMNGIMNRWMNEWNNDLPMSMVKKAIADALSSGFFSQY